MSSPDRKTYDDQLLMRYLLGMLPEEEAEHLDELSIADDEFAWRLKAVENDMMDTYVSGGLSGETLERFQSVYLRSAEHHEKVSFAKSLHFVGQRAGKPKSKPFIALKPANPPRSRLFSIQPAWGFAAGLVMLLAGGYLFRQNIGLRDQLKRSEAERSALRQRALELQSQLDGLRPAIQNGQTVLPTQALKTVSFVLLAQTRGINQLPSIGVPSDTSNVNLQLGLESDDFPLYQATLKDPAANKIILSRPLKSSRQGDDHIVLLSLDASLLKQQNYILELTGIPATGAPEFIAGYPFRVVRDAKR